MIETVRAAALVAVRLTLPASLIGCAGSVAGRYVSYTYDLAAGGSVVVVLTGLFLVTWCLAPGHGLLARPVRETDRPAPVLAGR